MAPDAWMLYEWMLRCRLLEQETVRLWDAGMISGELHLGTGEEALIAGVVPQLRDGDALALDHRGTAALALRGVDPVLILRELLGRPDGLCRGMGGHMHLHSREHLAAASGIVGAVGPAAAGFALAAQYLRPGTVSVGFFGEGAVNEGMLMEALNLAAVWRLPAVFVCKDDSWSITTRSSTMTGGSLIERARAMGLATAEVDGLDVLAVWRAAGEALERARSGGGPTFLLARCVHLEGHFLGFQLLRMLRRPLAEGPAMMLGLIRALIRRGGAPIRDRIAGLRAVTGATSDALRDPRRNPRNDPLWRARHTLRSDTVRLADLDARVRQEVAGSVATALEELVA